MRRFDSDDSSCGLFGELCQRSAPVPAAPSRPASSTDFLAGTLRSQSATMATQEPQSSDEPVLETAEDTARVSNAVDLLMDLCAERGDQYDETALDVVAHVGAEVRAMAQRVAATIKSKAHASVAVEDLQALHARAMSALETAGIPSSMEKVVAKLQACLLYTSPSPRD